LLLFLALLAAAPAPAPARAETTPRQLVQLLDYLGRDYGGAVRGGKVVSEFEYGEQQEFARTVQSQAAAIPALAADAALTDGLRTLAARIDAKADAAEITALTARLRTQVIARTALPTAPPAWPDLTAGRQVYAANCAGCHGAEGRGDGAQAKGLTPPPSSFHDAARMGRLTPFQAFNTVRNGVPGTAMQALPQIDDAKAWDVAFYVFTLRHPQAGTAGLPRPVVNQTLPALTDLAELSDTALAARLTGTRAQVAQLVAALRHDARQVLGAQTRLATARARLAEAAARYAAGDLDQAQKAALLAYLDGIEPFEVRLAARDAAIVPRVEKAMFAVRTAVNERAGAPAVERAVAGAVGVIAEAEGVLGGEAMSYGMTLSTSLLIMLREGFEAILIVVALFAVLGKLGAHKAKRWTHAGWVLALVAGAATWVLSETLIDISGAQREILEGVVGLFAVGVLIYMGIWLHNQSEIRKWTAFVNAKAREAIAEERYYTFFGIAFLAVYREVFETVLFYRALALDTTPDTEGALLAGLAIGVVLIAGMAWAMLKIGARVPVNRFFQVSAALIFALTVVLLGKGVHALQEAGWFSITSFPVNLRSDVLGVFPTYETLVSQALLVAVLVLVRRRLTVGEPKRAPVQP
jgi:high-affinity iron transporter